MIIGSIFKEANIPYHNDKSYPDNHFQKISNYKWNYS